MRRLAGICFLLLFLANIIGYYGLLMITKSRIESRITERVESRTHELSGSLIIKMPLNLPYPITDSDDFVATSGKIKYGNNNYQIIKQRVYQDTLQIVCIPVQGMEKINAAISDYVKTFSDTPSQQKTMAKINFLKDYIPSKTEIVADVAAWHRDLAGQIYFNYYSFVYTPQTLRPPDFHA
ncbi:MAG TPA: hypothetical protein VFW11_09990 [Cyclobacteriaceae bacterium]|nr:hypothetical protein [Cyclobacteriaceae bacterium]